MLFGTPLKRRLTVALRSLVLMMFVITAPGQAEVSATEGTSLFSSVDGADLSLMTDLWRSAYGTSSERLEQESDGNESPGTLPPRSPSDSLPGDREGVEMISSDLPIASTEESQPGEFPSDDLAMMSDWETSESQAGAGREKTFTKDGPSAVTAVVAIVCFIVVGGAYLSGRKSS